MKTLELDLGKGRERYKLLHQKDDFKDRLQLPKQNYL